MSEKLTNNARVIKRDSRSFIELWASLPEVSREELIIKFQQHGVSRQSIYSYMCGRRPYAARAAIIVKTLRAAYGISTTVGTLFPLREKRLALAAVYRSSAPKIKEGWDGKVDWTQIINEDNSSDD